MIKISLWDFKRNFNKSHATKAKFNLNLNLLKNVEDIAILSTLKAFN